jgi:hypothetical protein
MAEYEEVFYISPALETIVIGCLRCQHTRLLRLYALETGPFLKPRVFWIWNRKRKTAKKHYLLFRAHAEQIIPASAAGSREFR